MFWLPILLPFLANVHSRECANCRKKRALDETDTTDAKKAKSDGEEEKETENVATTA